MKKSEIYKNAIMAVIYVDSLFIEEKIDILRVLFEDEKVAKYTEDLEETKKQAVAAV